MGDIARVSRDDEFFSLAASQAGYVTARQARNVGFSDDLIQYQLRSGKLLRQRRGLYRLRHYPSSEHEEVMAAWLAVPKSVVSHETALVLHNLTDLIPSDIHLTVPRTKRHLPDIPGVRIHTSSEPPIGEDIVTREGMRVTSIPRTIVDLIQANEISPEHVEHAVWRAFGSHLASATELEAVAKRRHLPLSRLEAAYQRQGGTTQ
jgi:predicted transcriptional regulator of viral defense system